MTIFGWLVMAEAKASKELWYTTRKDGARHYHLLNVCFVRLPEFSRAVIVKVILPFVLLQFCVGKP